MDDPIKLIEDHQKRVAMMNGDGLELGPDANSLDFLQAVYRCPNLPLSTRMRAAGLALPFEKPKLAVTAVVNEVEDFAVALDRRIARAREMRQLPSPVIESGPSSSNGQLRRRV
jgi:hypothetical protein